MSEYFTYFPKINYDPYGTQPTETVLATNIFVRNKLTAEIKNQTAIFYPYIINEGERPDILAYNYYGSVRYTWLIFFANEIVDPYFGWPMSDSQFSAYIKRKYGNIQMAKNNIHSYYEIVLPATTQTQQITVQVDLNRYNQLESTKRYSKTYLDYEIEENDKKRSINLIEDVYIKNIFNQAKKTLR